MMIFWKLPDGRNATTALSMEGIAAARTALGDTAATPAAICAYEAAKLQARGDVPVTWTFAAYSE